MVLDEEFNHGLARERLGIGEYFPFRKVTRDDVFLEAIPVDILLEESKLIRRRFVLAVNVLNCIGFGFQAQLIGICVT